MLWVKFHFAELPRYNPCLCAYAATAIVPALKPVFHDKSAVSSREAERIQTPFQGGLGVASAHVERTVLAESRKSCTCLETTDFPTCNVSGTTNANQGSTSTGTAAPGNQRFSRAGSSDARAGVFVFPSSVALEGGGKWDAAVADQSPESGHMRWPVWVRACEPGTMKLRMVVYYEPTSRPGDRKVKQDIAYRVLRMDAAVQVGCYVEVRATLACPTCFMCLWLGWDFHTDICARSSIFIIGLGAENGVGCLIYKNSPECLPRVPSPTQCACEKHG